jgi:peptidoglycan/LPS O-acetylase OafA/YrhL
MAVVASEWFPATEDFFLAHGLLAVQVFLVVGGYLNAKSWSRVLADQKIQAMSRIWSRYTRLAIPLFVALSFAVLVTALIRPFFDHSSLSAAPTPLQVLAHVFFLQDILFLEAFSAGVWYVAIDFQLFVIAIVCAGLAHAWQRFSETGSVVRKALFLWTTLTLISLFVWNLHPLGEIWGTYFFGAYGLGLCIGCWRYANLRYSYFHLSLLIVLVGALAFAYQPRERLAVAVATAFFLCLYEASECKPVQFLKASWLRNFSDATYAIFVIHFGVSLLISALVFNFWSENIPINLMGLLLSFALSIWLGRLIQLHIESKPASFSRLLKWAAIFAASSSIAMWLS